VGFPQFSSRLELVQLHGGAIEVQSELGSGSEFTFTLPADPGSLDATEAASRQSAAGLSH
jgi:signal transduction histidine kinase